MRWNSSNELGRLPLNMTPLCKESASNGSVRLPFIQGRTRHNVPLPLPVNTPLAHWRAQKTLYSGMGGPMHARPEIIHFTSGSKLRTERAQHRHEGPCRARRDPFHAWGGPTQACRLSWLNLSRPEKTHPGPGRTHSWPERAHPRPERAQFVLQGPLKGWNWPRQVWEGPLQAWKRVLKLCKGPLLVLQGASCFVTSTKGPRRCPIESPRTS